MGVLLIVGHADDICSVRLFNGFYMASMVGLAIFSH